ncbi:MAG: transposase [Gammaproteobacteria bacterium]|nr:transposase [Gammaproteobacteria bacterium]
MLKRAHKGVYHRLSPKHLQAYVDTFAGRQNVREMDTLAQLQRMSSPG